MKIRKATINDLDEITKIEATCFPLKEAATKESFEKRLLVYSDYFWILENEDGKIVSFTNGMVTNNENLTDEMYENSKLHDENGEWQMIFGVNTLPEYRENGYAEMLIKEMINDAKFKNRKGIVLTCKEKLVRYYEKIGFVNEGISESTHGGVVWYEMRIKF